MRESGRGKEKEVWTLASQSVPCTSSPGSPPGPGESHGSQGHAHTLLLNQNPPFNRTQLVTCTFKFEKHWSILAGCGERALRARRRGWRSRDMCKEDGSEGSCEISCAVRSVAVIKISPWVELRFMSEYRNLDY